MQQLFQVLFALNSILKIKILKMSKRQITRTLTHYYCFSMFTYTC